MSDNSLCVALLTHKVSGSQALKWKVNKQFWEQEETMEHGRTSCNCLSFGE
jgi:hypothetical protein